MRGGALCCLWRCRCSGRRASCSVGPSCLVCPWRRWCGGRRRARLCGPGCFVCPWAAARPRAVRVASLWLGALSRRPARPRHRPRAPQPGPLGPPALSTPAAPGVPSVVSERCLEARPGPATATGTAAWPSVASGSLHTGSDGGLAALGADCQRVGGVSRF